MTNARAGSWRKRIQREKLFMRQGGFCYYCLESVEMSVPPRHPKRGTLDHIKPIKAGGANSWDNLVLACFRCNQLKAAQPEAEFRKRFAR